MTDEGFRKVALGGVLVILAGMFIAGMPLVWVVTENVYGVAGPMKVGGDYRAWLMAHLEGILNGLLIIALGAIARMRPISSRVEAWLIWSLIIAAWGNFIASVIAAVTGTRGMALSGDAMNNLAFWIFNLAFVATLIAFALVIRGLWGSVKPSERSV